MGGFRDSSHITGGKTFGNIQDCDNDIPHHMDLEYSETLFIRSNGLNQMSNRLDILLSAISYIDVLQVHLSVITDKQFVVMTKL